MGFIAGAHYTERDLRRATTLVSGKSPAETLLAIYRVSPSMQRNVALRHGAWCCCATLLAPPVAPLAWWLTCFEYKSGLQGTLMVVTDRTVYRHIDDHTSLSLSRAMKGTCGTVIGVPTGSRSGKLPLARIESIGRSPKHLFLLDGAAGEPSTEACCVSYDMCSGVARVHPVIVGIKQQAGRQSGGAKTFTIFADSEEEADAAVQLIKDGAKAAQAGLPTLAEQAKAKRSDTIRRHSDTAVQQMSMERDGDDTGVVVPVGKSRRPRSISFEHLDTLESSDGYESATASSQAAATTATSAGANDETRAQQPSEGAVSSWFNGNKAAQQNEA